MDTENKTKVQEPTKEQVIKFYAEQIEVAKLRKELAELLAGTAEADARRTEANAKVAYFTNPPAAAQDGPAKRPQENSVDHIVTQEDLDNNPDLSANGIKVGDTVAVMEPTLKPV